MKLHVMVYLLDMLPIKVLLNLPDSKDIIFGLLAGLIF